MTSGLFPRPSNWTILLWLIVSTPYTVPLNAAPTFSENQNTSVNRVLASPIEVYFVDGSYMTVQSYEVREKLVLLLTPEGKLHSVLRSLVDMVATELGQQAILGESVSIDELIDDPHTPTAPEVMNRNEEGLDSRSEVIIRAVRVAEAPLLDGILDESLWQQAPIFDSFVHSSVETSTII